MCESFSPRSNPPVFTSALQEEYRCQPSLFPPHSSISGRSSPSNFLLPLFALTQHPSQEGVIWKPKGFAALSGTGSRQEVDPYFFLLLQNQSNRLIPSPITTCWGLLFLSDPLPNRSQRHSPPAFLSPIHLSIPISDTRKLSCEDTGWAGWANR